MINQHHHSIWGNDILPVEIVLHPSWWFHHEGITFDEDFFYHPKKRVESERAMERILYERWGNFGLGQDRDKDIPQIGPVHLASGFPIADMLGCEIVYRENSSPHVVPLNSEKLKIDPERAFRSPGFKKMEKLIDTLKTTYGYVTGDLNWSGVLNAALDVRGQQAFLDIFENPEDLRGFLSDIAGVLEKFFTGVLRETGTTSITANRTVRHIPSPVCLHSSCTLTMISTDDYENYLSSYDHAWSLKYRPYGIHFCGTDPHRYAENFAKIPHLDFLDVGWGGDVRILRKYLPNTFLNIRLSPVELIDWNQEEIRDAIRTRVEDSGNPWLTGVCCINIDHQAPDDNITAIFETVQELRREYSDQNR